jgi:hypothetical protein
MRPQVMLHVPVKGATDRQKRPECTVVKHGRQMAKNKLIDLNVANSIGTVALIMPVVRMLTVS